MSDPERGRRDVVLRIALETFARYGYRKTSMEDVARAADISRPGLYFLFDSKQNLFRAAVIRALDEDLEGARRSLADAGRPLRARLIEAFDLWAGRYTGVLAREVAVLVDASPELLGEVVAEYPGRFAELVTAAIEADGGAARGADGGAARGVGAAAARGAVEVDGRAGLAAEVAQTLLSAAAGIKHEVSTRDEFLARFTVAVDLLLVALRA